MIDDVIKKALVNSKSSIEFAVLKAFIIVESGGKGFDEVTGKLIIQFEPLWFKRKMPNAPDGKWLLNKVEVQSKEWLAFNDAFAINANAAMESTSIGLPQIMGFHWKRLGYKSVGAMWDDFKLGLQPQIEALIRFIESDFHLYSAILKKDWHAIASIYNGSGYLKLAKDLGREPYNVSLEKAYQRNV